MNISMTAMEYHELLERAKRAEEHAAVMAAKLSEYRRNAAPEIPRLLDAIARAMPVIRFAIAHLPPEVYPRWPAADLIAFADAYEARPGASLDDHSFAVDARSFAAQALRLDEMRSRRDGNGLPTP